MIDFRYHLVSIVAVFLALAIGIVIGSTSVLKGAVLSGLQKTSAAEKSRIDSLYAQNGQLKQQLQRGPVVRLSQRAACCWTACSPGSGSCWSRRPARPAR